MHNAQSVSLIASIRNQLDVIRQWWMRFEARQAAPVRRLPVPGVVRTLPAEWLYPSRSVA